MDVYSNILSEIIQWQQQETIYSNEYENSVYCVCLVCLSNFFPPKLIWFYFGIFKLQVEIAQPLSKLCLEFPDLYIGMKFMSCCDVYQYVTCYLIRSIFLIVFLLCNIQAVTAMPDMDLLQ